MDEHDLRSAASVIQRMKKTLGADSDRELAERLKVSPRAISAWRTRNAVPYEKCVELAVRLVVPLDWLLLGESVTGHGTEWKSSVDYDLLRRIIERTEERFAETYGEESLTMGRDKASWIISTYVWWSRNLEQVMNTGKFTREEAIQLIETLASEPDQLGLPQ